MAIYTRFGGKVEITASRIVPVWAAQKKSDGSIEWLYSRPCRETIKKYESIEAPFTAWFFKGKADHGKGPAVICDGLWVSENNLRADDGIKEIRDALEAKNPTEQALFDSWAKNPDDKRDAGDVFYWMNPAEVA